MPKQMSIYDKIQEDLKKFIKIAPNQNIKADSDGKILNWNELNQNTKDKLKKDQR